MQQSHGLFAIAKLLVSYVVLKEIGFGRGFNPLQKILEFLRPSGVSWRGLYILPLNFFCHALS